MATPMTVATFDSSEFRPEHTLSRRLCHYKPSGVQVSILDRFVTQCRGHSTGNWRFIPGTRCVKLLRSRQKLLPTKGERVLTLRFHSQSSVILRAFSPRLLTNT